MAKTMKDYAKGWKSPEERREMRSAGKAPKKAAKGKDSADSKDGGVNGWHSARSLKQPKGC